MLYTRKGDNGTSQLFDRKDRLTKDSPIFHALGTLDELNALLGICHVKARGLQGDIAIEKEVRAIQEDLFIIQAQLAGAKKALYAARIQEIERVIGAIEGIIEPPHSFIIPGATELSAFLDYARAVSRRAERLVITAQEVHDIGEHSRTYLNRLSSILYALARYAAHIAHTEEQKPSY